MSVLFLSEDDVREVLDMEICLATVEDAFRQLGTGGASNVPRARARTKGATLHTMSAAAEYLGYVGWKCYTTTASGARFHIGLSSASTGQMVALLEADFLGQMRTGAASGVATSYMARHDAHVVGLFGTGKQARTQLKAVCEVRKIRRVEVYSRNPERCAKFADEMSEWCDTHIVPVHSPQEAAREKDIVICATSSSVPLFEGECLDEGTHLNVIGSNYLHKAEVDITTLRRADIIVCDSIPQCKLEAGDFVSAIEGGAIDWASFHELSEVVNGLQHGRATNENITLFKSVGLAIEDVAVAARVVQLASTRNLGCRLPI